MRTEHARTAAFGVLIALAAAAPLAADYATQIEYREAIELIVSEQDLNAGGWTHGIDWIAESGDGSKVCFWTIAHQSGQPNRRHFWICNADGSGLRDITPAWSTDENPRWPRLNYDGSRMFYVAFYHNSLRYIDTNTGAKVDAVMAATDLNFRKPYEINRNGTRAFFLDWNSNAVDCGRYGVAQADIPGDPAFIYTLANLPYDDYCNKNRIALLGVSDTGRAAISWSTEDYGANCTSMFVGGPGAPVRVPNEQVQFVYSLQDLPHRQMSRDGRRVLYHTGTGLADGTIDNAFELIEPDSGRRVMLVDHGVYHQVAGRPCISPDGGVVRYNDPFGAYATRVTLAADASIVSIRDTISYHTPLLSPWTLSDMCEGGYRWFGFSSQDWGAKQKLWRFELNYDQTGGSSGQCPVVQRVGWSHPMLLKDDAMKITAYVRVSDPQGLGDIDWVQVVGLIDYGRETAIWDTKGRQPLSSGGDMGSATLNDGGPDDGRGDEVAGDGIYTFHGFWTRSYSDFWEHYAAEGFPIQVPIRVVVKDKSDNYMIVDTQLSVTDDPADIAVDGGDGDDDDGADDDGTDDDGDDDDGDDGDEPDDDGDDSDDDGSGDDEPNVPVDDDESDGGIVPAVGMCPSTAVLMVTLSAVGAVCLRPRRRH